MNKQNNNMETLMKRLQNLGYSEMNLLKISSFFFIIFQTFLVTKSSWVYIVAETVVSFNQNSYSVFMSKFPNTDFASNTFATQVMGIFMYLKFAKAILHT